MTSADILNTLLERLVASPANQAIFCADEITEWPADLVASLIDIGMLRQAAPASVVECDGCEENCLMPVHVYPAKEQRISHAFIACDKRDDIGRVPVDMHRLKVWQFTSSLLTKTLAQLLGFTQAPQTDNSDTRWTLGVLKGKKHSSPIALMIDGSVTLSLAGHTVPLQDVLSFNATRLTLNKRELQRCIDQPAQPPQPPKSARHPTPETPDARRTRLKARTHAEKAKGTRAFLQVVAKEEGIAVSRLKQIISSKPTTSAA